TVWCSVGWLSHPPPTNDGPARSLTGALPTSARPGATRAAARVGGGADAGAARPLGGATRPPVRGGRATAGGAGRRGRAAHGAGPQLVAGARPRDRGDAAVVHSTHVAPGRAAPSHRSTR